MSPRLESKTNLPPVLRINLIFKSLASEAGNQLICRIQYNTISYEQNCSIYCCFNMRAHYANFKCYAVLLHNKIIEGHINQDIDQQIFIKCVNKLVLHEGYVNISKKRNVEKVKFVRLCFLCQSFVLICAKQTSIIGHLILCISLFSLGFKSEIMLNAVSVFYCLEHVQQRDVDVAIHAYGACLARALH